MLQRERLYTLGTTGGQWSQYFSCSALELVNEAVYPRFEYQEVVQFAVEFRVMGMVQGTLRRVSTHVMTTTPLYNSRPGIYTYVYFLQG